MGSVNLGTSCANLAPGFSYVALSQSTASAVVISATVAPTVWQAVLARFARVGRGEGAVDGALRESPIRGSSVCWLDASMPVGQLFMRWMEGLRVSLNRDLFLGLDSFEAQPSVGPRSARTT